MDFQDQMRTVLDTWSAKSSFSLAPVLTHYQTSIHIPGMKGILTAELLKNKIENWLYIEDKKSVKTCASGLCSAWAHKIIQNVLHLVLILSILEEKSSKASVDCCGICPFCRGLSGEAENSEQSKCKPWRILCTCFLWDKVPWTIFAHVCVYTRVVVSWLEALQTGH